MDPKITYGGDYVRTQKVEQVRHEIMADVEGYIRRREVAAWQKFLAIHGDDDIEYLIANMVKNDSNKTA